MNITDLELARLSELIVEDLTGELNAEEAAEYAELRARHPDFDVVDFERAAAALQLAAMSTTDPIPERLRITLAMDAADYFGPAPIAGATTLADVGAAPRRSLFERPPHAGWWAIAAGLALAVIVWFERPPRVTVADMPNSRPAVQTASPASAPLPVTAPFPSQEPLGNPVAQRALRQIALPGTDTLDPVAAREQLLAANPFLLHRSWRAGNDPAGQRVSGDVVWDPRTQRGFMRFVGLRPNNPNVEQYQLWIFDARRDERYPVDGGVFDVASDQGAVVIAIKAGLKVDLPLMFAVTIERPGGVVVSDRSRIAALANSG